eukprot:5291235-Lingulodinium_polyedra.AAC.1
MSGGCLVVVKQEQGSFGQGPLGAWRCAGENRKASAAALDQNVVKRTHQNTRCLPALDLLLGPLAL